MLGGKATTACPKRSDWRPRTARCANFFKIKKEDCSPDELRYHVSSLSVLPNVPAFVKSLKRKKGDDGFYAFFESARELWVPRFYGLEYSLSGNPRIGVPEDNYRIDDQTSYGAPMASAALAFTGTLREDVPQKVAFDTIMEKFKPGAPATAGATATAGAMCGGIVQLPCGFGKTVLAIAIAAALGRRTLILVQQDNLMSQWQERIAQFLPGARVGIIKGNRNDLEDDCCCDLIIAMIQTMASRYSHKDISKFASIGFLVVDECHHISAQYFSTALHAISSRYTLGLSATPERIDGLTRLIHYTLGPMLFKADACLFQDGSKTKVLVLNYTDGAQKEISGRDGNPLRPQMINALAAEHARNMMIVQVLLSIDTSTRKIIVLSDRIKQLETIFRELSLARARANGGSSSSGGGKAYREYTHGKYIGSMKEVHRKEVADECAIILATSRIAAEALDIPRLDTLVFATPQSRIEQSVGRILRKHPDKADPLVIDILDDFSYYAAQYKTRRLFYRKHGYCSFMYDYPRQWDSVKNILTSENKSNDE